MSHSYTICHKTEVVKNTLDPVWQAFKIPVRALCNGDYDRYNAAHSRNPASPQQLLTDNCSVFRIPHFRAAEVFRRGGDTWRQREIN